MICDFGRNKDGLYLYRVNGNKKEIQKYIDMLKEIGCEFYDPIKLEESHKDYSVLLKIKFPPEVEKQLEKEKRELEERNKELDAIRDRLKANKKKGIE